MRSPPTSSTADDAGAESRDAGAESREGDATLAALRGDVAREARFWRARAEQLAADLAELEARLLALAGCLPARHAELLTRDPRDLERATAWPDPLEGWRETTSLESASVATELQRLWTRLHPLP